MNTIGNKLRELRERKNLSSKELSEKVDINPSTYSKLENDKKSIGIDELKKICEYHNVSADYILDIGNEADEVIQYMTKNKKMSKDDIHEIGMVFEMMDEAMNLYQMKKRY